jgi:excisionase family DNA binding protein
MEKLLNSDQLAEVLSVKKGTIYSWISRNIEIPYIKIGGSVRFREKAILDWLLQKEKERKRRNFDFKGDRATD